MIKKHIAKFRQPKKDYRAKKFGLLPINQTTKK